MQLGHCLSDIYIMINTYKYKHKYHKITMVTSHSNTRKNVEKCI